RWLFVALAALLALAGAGGYRLFFAAPAAPQYRTAALERGPLRAVVSSTGNLNAVIMVLVGSQVSGTIKELSADFNTPVKTGQVIAQIDPALFQAAVSSASADLQAAQSAVRNQQAQVQQARSNIANAEAAAAEGRAQTAKALVAVADARRTLGRQSELLGRGLIAEADRDTAQTAYDAALAQHDSAVAHARALDEAIDAATAQGSVQEAALDTARQQVKQKEAALAQAQINLDHTTIRSPVDGVVVNRAVDVGQTVAATLQAPTLFTIARDLTKMQVETSVDEADIGRIRPTTPVTFTVDAFPGETFAGEISQIRKAPQVAQNVVTYTVVVAVANPSAKLLPGMTANVKFVTAERGDALKVPNTALRFRPPDAPAPTSERSGTARERQRTSGTVWILGDDGRPQPVAVTLGITDGVSTEVTGGDLAAGRQVLVGLASDGAATPPSAGNTRLPRL
ncbi:MAG TPA: efflux RND transporter periplasmic adaptor subunit, partial [Methylomirabilota bacterium]|nr:efflux RND transporter periplasmic adaptor subunit [Methylomirabilota bacterium]